MPLADASVNVKGLKQGVKTNAAGKFTINAPVGPQTLIISYVGMKTTEVAVTAEANAVTVSLIESEGSLDEVQIVSTGYQSLPKERATGSFGVISRQQLDKPTTNISSRIIGTTSGVQALRMDEEGNPFFQIRGLSTLFANQEPLVVVDGFPIQGGYNTLNPNDIESIEVLKDASAAAIYGARAANGVILITTKRGKSGGQEASFNIYSGIQQISRPIKFMDSKEMVGLIEEARANDLAIFTKDPSYFGDNFDPSVLTDPLDNFDLSSEVNTNWLDEVSRLALINNYEFSFRAGNEKTKYFTSLGYFDQQGVIIENYYKRFNYRLNLDHEINSRFKLGITFNTTYSKNRRSFNDNTYTGIITNALGASPLMPAYEEDGSYAGF
jgi:TonB-dependent SusC/RagA subfamily outer membrane receptor